MADGGGQAKSREEIPFPGGLYSLWITPAVISSRDINKCVSCCGGSNPIRQRPTCMYRLFDVEYEGMCSVLAAALHVVLPPSSPPRRCSCTIGYSTGNGYWLQRPEMEGA